MPGRRLTPATLREQIASGTLDAVYLLFGDDEAEKLALAGLFVTAVEEEVRAFNVQRLHGNEPSTTMAVVLDCARTLPWLASRRIVLVLEAEKVIVPRREGEAADRDLDQLEGYLKSPQPHAVLVFVAGPLDRRRRGVSMLSRYATLVECRGFDKPEDAPRWIRAYVADAGGRIDGGATRLLAERAAHDVTRLRADLDRLLTYVAGERPITAADVEQVASGTTLTDDWAMVRAVEAGATGAALRELALAFEAGLQPLQILGQLGHLVRESPPRGRFPAGRLQQAVEALYRTDLALKTTGSDPRVLLERLVVELCASTADSSDRRARL